MNFVDDKAIWNSYITQNSATDGSFLQSWEWGEFQRAYGRKVFRVAMAENNEIAYGWQIIEMPLPFGVRYWYIPRPAGIFNFQFSIFNFFNEVSKLAKKEKAVFIRVDGGSEELKNFGFQKVNISIQPEEELILDITKSQEELFTQMKPKTRYNIRVAEKHGVKINPPLFPPLPKGGSGGVDFQKRGKEGSALFEIFWNLIRKTAKRQGIQPHPKEYYKKMIEVLGASNTARLYFAEYQNTYIAGALVCFFGKTATYLHGGTDDAYKNVMAPYLLHWQAIQDAKDSGCEFYNFGGVSSTKKSWEGITRFKLGFSPKTKFTRYGGVWDRPVRKGWHWAYTFLKKCKM